VITVIPAINMEDVDNSVTLEIGPNLGSVNPDGNPVTVQFDANSEGTDMGDNSVTLQVGNTGVEQFDVNQGAVNMGDNSGTVQFNIDMGAMNTDDAEPIQHNADLDSVNNADNDGTVQIDVNLGAGDIGDTTGTLESNSDEMPMSDSREAAAATTIQAAFRGYQTRESLGSDNMTLLSPAREKDMKLEQDAAVKKIQTINRWNLKKDAATRIQACYRGHQARKAILVDYFRKQQQVAIQMAAAAKIQMWYKSYMERKQKKKV